MTIFKILFVTGTQSILLFRCVLCHLLTTADRLSVAQRNLSERNIFETSTTSIIATRTGDNS